MTGRFIRKISFFIILGLNCITAAPLYAEQSVFVNEINAGLVGEKEFIDGYVLIPAVPVYWESDVPFRITVSSLEPELGVSDGSSYAKSLHDLQWKITDEETWIPVSQDKEEVAFGAEGGSGVIYIDVLIYLDWLKDFPGKYAVALIFSIEPI